MRTIVDIENLIYRKGFLRKVVSKDGYEEAVKAVQHTPPDKLLNILSDSMANRKTLALLAVSEATLRKPFLRYKLAPELLGRGRTEVVDALGVDREAVQLVQLGKLMLSEESLESLYECRRLNIRGGPADVKLCREQYIYSLLGTKNISIEFLSALLPLATVPSYLDVKNLGYDRNACASSWPYTACLDVGRGIVSWYFLSSLLAEGSVEVPKGVTDVESFAVGESAIFVARRAELDELAIFSSPYRNAKYVKCLKACYDGVGSVYVLRSGRDNPFLVVLDDKGVEVYERALDISLKDAELVSCKPLYGGGVLFSIVKPNKTVLVVAKENRVKDLLFTERIHALITMPLNIVLGFSRKNVYVLWVGLKDGQIEVFEDRVEVEVPLEDVVAIPGLGIATVTNDGLAVVNSLGTMLASVKLWSRKPREVRTISLPTFALLFARGDDGYIDRVVMVKEDGLKDVELHFLKNHRVKDILYGNNTVCFVLGTNAISCLSPIYLKTALEVSSQPGARPRSVQEVLRLYRAAKTSSELALSIEAASSTIDAKHLEKLLYELSVIYGDIRKRVDVSRLDVENIINRSIEMDVPVDWVELALFEYSEKAARWSEAGKVALARIGDILSHTQRSAVTYINLDALMNARNALELLAKREYLESLSLNEVVKLLIKVLSSLEALGIEATPKTLTKVLPKECVNTVAVKMLDIIKRRVKDVRYHLVKSYLADFGLDIESIRDRLEEVARLLEDLGLERYLESLEAKISRSVLERGIESLNELLTTNISILRRSLDLAEKQPEVLRAGAKEEVVNLLRLYLNNKIDEKAYLKELQGMEVCYRELPVYYQEALAITSRYDVLSSVSIYTHISKKYACREMLESLKELTLKLKRVSSIIEEMDLLLRELGKCPVVPKNVESIKIAVRDSISNLDVANALKEVSKLKRCLDKARSFNEALRKLEQLTEAPFFVDARRLLGALAGEFTEIDFDKTDPNSLRRMARIEKLIADTKRLNIEHIINYINGLEEKAKILRIDVRILVSSLAGKFLEKLLNEGLDHSIKYLNQVEEYLTQIQGLADRYDKEVNNLKTQLLHIGIESQAVDSIVQREEDLFKDVSTSTADDVLKMLENYIKVTESKISILRELSSDAQRLLRQLNSLEQEIVEAIRRSFLSTDTILANPTFKFLKEYINRLSSIVGGKSLQEVNDMLRVLKSSRNDLKSKSAISLLSKVIEVSIESMVKSSFSPQSIQEAKQLLAYGIKEYGDMKYSYLDKILSSLDETGLNLAKFAEFPAESFVDTISALIGKLKKLNEVREFIDTCPDVVAKLIEINGGVDSRVVYGLNFAKELGQSVENICNIYRRGQFNDVGEGILWVLASIGEKDSGLRVRSKLALAYSTFMTYFGEWASEHVECRDLTQESGILGEIYKEYCVNNNVKKALEHSVLACTEAKHSSDCRIAVGLLGGFHVKQLIKYIYAISTTLNVNIDRGSLKRYVISSLLKAIDSGGSISLQELVKNHEDIYKELLRNSREVVEGFNKVRGRVGGDVSKLIQAINLFIDSVRKTNVLDKEKVDLAVYGEIDEGRESTLEIKIFNNMDVMPLSIKELTLDFADIGYRYPLRVSLNIEPMSCSSISVTIPGRRFDPAKLALGKEVGLNIEFKYTLPIATREMLYSVATSVPVKYYGRRGDLIETVEDVASKLKERISVDTARLHETLIAVGGNNIVVLGQLENDRSRVVVKIPVFYKDIASITIDRNLIKRCEELAHKCREATKKCSTTPIVEILDISLVPPYAVERYVVGESLRKLIRDRGRLSMPEAVEVTIRVGEGVKCLHSQDIYHNDIRPENVIVKMVGERIVDVYLIDSCIDNVWREYRSSLGIRDMRTSAVGSEIDERYQHPNLERMLKKAEEEKDFKKMLGIYKNIDVFQVGVLLAEMVLGYNPVPMIKGLGTVRTILPSTIPIELGDMLERILIPGESYVTLDEFLACLKGLRVK